MKNLYATLFLAILGFSGQLNAQTLKNIHRHNQPVLRIPTHLIDKVETAEVNGVQVLQVRQLNGYVSEIPLSQIDSITHSDGEAVDPAQLGNLRYASVMGVVSGPTGAPEMNAIVRSPYGGEETRTDPNGVFFLSNILVYDKLGYITITKPGFHQGSRSFLPLETGSNRINVQLLPMTQSGTFSAASGGTVTSGLLQLNFPANAIIRSNGQPYTGTVSVYAAALDPTSTAMFDQMPGELLGGMNDSLRLLRSFGMASIELRDASMNELQLATGLSATLRFNIPTSLQAEAPATIDWWSYDETLGYWKHEGAAQKTGTQYIGQASHFSWWNCDIPENFNDLHGVVHSTDGTVVSNAQVNVISPTLGQGVTYTNNTGAFVGRVPKNQQITLNIKLVCNTTSDWTIAHSDTIYSALDAISLSIIAGLEERFPITGTIVDCDGVAVESGYVKIGSSVFITGGGEFTIQACAIGNYNIQGFDNTNPSSIKASALSNVEVITEGANLGEILACTEVYGGIIDNDGNYYSTILIGNQFWTTENLRSSRYSNNDPIPQLTSLSAWEQLSSGAWCNYNNNVMYDSLYGKLYNWYTTVDPRGLCPIGWHVPTDQDWTILTDHLGGLSAAGGKLKSKNGWNTPNAAATNESGFSALPGGNLTSLGFSLNAIGNDGDWWSSSESDSSNGIDRYLGYGSGDVFIYNFDKNSGLSVRCVKD